MWPCTPTRKTSGVKASIFEETTYACFLFWRAALEIATFVHVHRAAEVTVNSTWRCSSVKLSMQAHIEEDAQRQHERGAAYYTGEPYSFLYRYSWSLNHICLFDSPVTLTTSIWTSFLPLLLCYKQGVRSLKLCSAIQHQGVILHTLLLDASKNRLGLNPEKHLVKRWW